MTGSSCLSLESKCLWFSTIHYCQKELRYDVERNVLLHYAKDFNLINLESDIEAVSIEHISLCRWSRILIKYDRTYMNEVRDYTSLIRWKSAMTFICVDVHTATPVKEVGIGLNFVESILDHETYISKLVNHHVICRNSFFEIDIRQWHGSFHNLSFPYGCFIVKQVTTNEETPRRGSLNSQNYVIWILVWVLNV